MLHFVLEGIQTVRTHSLDRCSKASTAVGGFTRNISINMAFERVKRNATGPIGTRQDGMGRDGMELNGPGRMGRDEIG